MTHAPEIAVITPGTLIGIGLRSILEKIIPGAVVTVFGRCDDFRRTDKRRFFHFFVAAPLFIEQGACFRGAEQRTILLCNGEPAAQLAGYHCLNILQDEADLVRDILRLHQNAHRHGHPVEMPPAPAPATLTPREKEVLAHLAGGLANKQIAARMGIGLTTVISHRRNITVKLGIRSVPGLTIYAVTHGLIDADTI